MIIRAGAIVENKFFWLGLKDFSNNEFSTTEIELIAIARPASSGFNINPNSTNTLAAIGIPITL